MASSATPRRRGRPRASERPEARERLMEAAEAVLAERGFRAATVDQIVTAAGLSKGTFYWHFESKHALFTALLEERLDRPARALMELVASAPADGVTAPAVNRGLAELLGRERVLVLLLHEYWSAAVRDERLGARYRERQAALRKALAAALASRHARTGVPLTMPAEALATAFIALAEGLSLHTLADEEAVPEGLFAEILSLVYDGLAARAG